MYDEAQAPTFGGAGANGKVPMLGMFNIVEHPALMARLKKELIEVRPVLDNSPLKFEELEILPFLVSESMRDL